MNVFTLDRFFGSLFVGRLLDLDFSFCFVLVVHLFIYTLKESIQVFWTELVIFSMFDGNLTQTSKWTKNEKKNPEGKPECSNEKRCLSVVRKWNTNDLIFNWSRQFLRKIVSLPVFSVSKIQIHFCFFCSW